MIKEPGKEYHVKKSHGTALKDISNDTLTLLHTILFGKRGKASLANKSISGFHGCFGCDNKILAQEKIAKVKGKLSKCLKQQLFEFCDVLEILISKASSRKEDIISRLNEFFFEHQATISELHTENEQSSYVEKHMRIEKANTKSIPPSISSSKIQQKTKRSSENSTKDEYRQSLSGDNTMKQNMLVIQEDGDSVMVQNLGLCFDFMECFHTELCLHIMSFIDEPIDLMRASAVSRSWHQFVVANGLAKQLCFRSFPKISNITCIQLIKEKFDVNDCTWESLVRQHKVFASFHALSKLKIPPRECALCAINASSTYEDLFSNSLSVRNTVVERTSDTRKPYHWSSKGQSSPEEPEALIYKNVEGFCVVSEIHIQPYEACFEPGKPIYASKSVRFHFGELLPEYNSEEELECRYSYSDHKFIWSYTSPEYPMAKENCLQRFVLPKPQYLRMLEYIKIELLGRVERQKNDGLFYICVENVRMLGFWVPCCCLRRMMPRGELWLYYNKSRGFDISYKEKCTKKNYWGICDCCKW